LGKPTKPAGSQHFCKYKFQFFSRSKEQFLFWKIGWREKGAVSGLVLSKKYGWRS
jgi:hypothetical protein